jgi:para-nitrobenzyl esterase
MFIDALRRIICRSSVLLLLAVSVQLSSASAAAAKTGQDPLRVETTEGPVVGLQHDGVVEFRGLPFAQPPVGTLRWAPPSAPSAHRDRLKADAFRDACPQVSRFHQTEASNTEDCLYLNVARPVNPPAEGGLRPVMVWFHGGAYVGGGANLYRIDRLAAQGDLVVVSVNYRLGALGFLSLPGMGTEAAGAFGIADQEAALQWLKANVTRFGGDPQRMTIAGESAGAASVCALLAAPERRGALIHSAIVQSVDCSVPWRSTALAGSQVGVPFAAALGCTGDDSLDCLRRTPVEQLLSAQTAMADTGASVWSPSVGSSVLPRDAAAAAQRGDIRVPVLFGGTSDEMRLYVGYEVAVSHPLTAADYLSRLEALYGSRAAAIAVEYPISAYSSPSTALGTVMSDFSPGLPLSNCGYLRFTALLRGQTAVYEYEFADRQAPPVMDDPGIELGAVHSSELPYFFPGFSNHSMWEGPALQPAQQRLADQMIELWSAFIHWDRPSAAGLPAWPAFNSPTDVYRLAPAELGPFDAGKAHHCAFWSSLYP